MKIFDPWTKIVCPFYKEEGKICLLLQVICLQSYFLKNPILILNTEMKNYYCSISDMTLSLEKGLRIHSMESKLLTIDGVEELDVIKILTHLGLISEIDIEYCIKLYQKGLTKSCE